MAANGTRLMLYAATTTPSQLRAATTTSWLIGTEYDMACRDGIQHDCSVRNTTRTIRMGYNMVDRNGLKEGRVWIFAFNRLSFDVFNILD